MRRELANANFANRPTGGPRLSNVPRRRDADVTDRDGARRPFDAWTEPESPRTLSLYPRGPTRADSRRISSERGRTKRHAATPGTAKQPKKRCIHARTCVRLHTGQIRDANGNTRSHPFYLADPYRSTRYTRAHVHTHTHVYICHEETHGTPWITGGSGDTHDLTRRHRDTYASIDTRPRPREKEK